MKKKADFQPKKAKLKFTKDTFVKIVITVVSSFILALMVKISSFDKSISAGEFFSRAVFLDVAIITVIMAAVLSTLFLYTVFVGRELYNNKKVFFLIALAIIITYGFALLFGYLINLYVVPLMLASLLIAALIDKRVAIITNAVISTAFFLTFVILSGRQDIFEAGASILTSLITGIIMVMFLEASGTRLKFIFTGILIGAASALLPILINLLNPAGGSIEQLLIYGLWAFISSVLTIGIYMLILPIFEFSFRLITNFRLYEIASFEFPLLKRLAKEAPGTFNHSLAVGNLAELCASAIGENAQLAKTSAYYHDVGKMLNPDYFVENQKGYNPHDDLIPEVSVKMITRHPEDGYLLIKKHKLPDIIANAAREHHGTTPVNFFLYKAQNLTESEITREEFSYQDPLPSSKISAIIMIADTVEAASRAYAGKISSREEFQTFIHKLIKDKADLNQFSNCELTFKELKLIEDTLVDAIPNMHHARIQYGKKKTDNN